MKLIDKEKVVAEIIKIYDRNRSNGYIDVCDEIDDILSFMDTLEVKEVDLDREIRRYRMNNPIIGHREGTLYDYMANAARHFFELGLKAQKGE